MSAIRILPDRVANQIAAGEVVERPAAVVKELVENAIDAGATRIEVEFRHGGRSLIRVEDNGCGMSRDDALLCLERHATSKIREAADLGRVQSFGFRGEALPSIASVSRFTLQTRTADQEHGTEVFVNGGRLDYVRECGMPAGTRIVVAQLFNSVPARRKFLKSDATEAAHIIHTCRLYALASPQVAFTLREDNQLIFQSPVCTSLLDRVREVFGERSAEGLTPVDAAENDLRLEGLIGRPGVTRSTRHEMITYVNRRPVDSRTLSYGLLESYHTLIPKGRYPVAFLFLAIDPAGVDVNVHPAKREVRFRDEPRVRGFTIRTVLATLREATAESRAAMAAAATLLEQTRAPASPSSSKLVPAPVAPPNAIPVSASSAPPQAGPGSTRVSRVGSGVSPEPSVPESVRRDAGHGTRDACAPRTDGKAPSPPVEIQRSVGSSAPEESPRAAPGWRHLGDLSGGYTLFETSAGLIVLDRRAAAERVWFERLLTQFATGRVESQRLLFPVPLQLDPIAAAALQERLPFLQAHGLELDLFGRDFFRIEAVPTWLEPQEAEAFLRDVMGLVRAGRMGGRDLAPLREELARLGAQRAAAVAAGALSAPLRDALVSDLLRCETPHTSPAGRPTFIEISAGELVRRFHKTPATPASAVREAEL